MKLSEKIIEFSSVNELLQAIKEDKSINHGLSRRYPVRFIFLQNFQTFKNISSALKELGIKEISIEDFLIRDDSWVDNDTLFNNIINTSNDILVVPFSEIARFYSKQDFQNFFTRLMTYENDNANRRIYLPLIGLYQQFETYFFETFTRCQECAPLWSMNGDKPQPVKIYLTPEIPEKGCEHLIRIKTAKDWLCFWKRYAPCNIVCSSKPLLFYYKNSDPETVFTLSKSENTKELIKQIYNIEIPIEYIKNEQPYWNNLFSHLDNNYSTYSRFLRQHCNVKNLNINGNFLEEWIRHEDIFTRWLLKNYVLSQECLSGKYIYKVLSSIEGYSNQTIFRHIYEDCFPIEENNRFLPERINLIQILAKYNIQLSDDTKTTLKQHIYSIQNVEQGVALCTGLFDFEQEFILDSFLKNKVPINSIEKRFPELVYYVSNSFLDNLDKEQQWIYKYISDYKKAKLFDNYSDNIRQVIFEKNANSDTFWNWYHSFESSKSILSQLQVDKIYWLDGLGLEWISFIEHYILSKSEEKISVRQRFVGRSELPTTTDYNQISDVYKRFENPDKYVHDNPYKYPQSILKEFEIIKQILDSILVNFGNNESVAIVSDHGLTMLPRLVDSKKYGKNDGHEGRYIEVQNEKYSDDVDYISSETTIDKKNYLIALKHNSLGKKPIREVHGGCTPEEVLVPILVISNKFEIDSDAIKEYKVDISRTEIQKTNPILEFSISDNPSVAFVEINGIQKRLQYNTETDRWFVMLDKSLSGKQNVKVIIAKKEYSFSINIKAGMQEEDLF
ncbi:MAG: BREX-4 system phosphatase PglZ [Bacteroidales bacterium]|jgi:hypothetical protein|nr:BREX-4 system phosphatase PglZ [Bacteroidales bacterium]